MRAKHSRASAIFQNRIYPFFAGEEVRGGPLLLATIVALICTNSVVATAYEQFWDTDLRLSFGAVSVSHTLAEWIDHALLPLFFVVIGADVKRELVDGSLSHWRTAAFPAIGAIGGMVVPVALFLLIAGPGEGRMGWGTVITMDTAFGLSILAIFGARLPAAVRALFLAFAAIDDIGGLLVIAFAYSEHLAWQGAMAAGAALVVMVVLRRLRWIAAPPYVVLGMIVWVGIFQSGVHATIAGVLIGLLLPVVPRLEREDFSDKVQHTIDEFQDAHSRAAEAGDDREFEKAEERAEDRLGYLQEMMRATDRTGERVIVTLTPWISYVVLPLFALSNIRIHLSEDLVAQAAGTSLTWAIVAGLVAGKPIGFLTFSWVAMRVGFARLPEDVTWRMIGAIGCLAGIGFTISLFIAGLAFAENTMVQQASLAILLASILSGALGTIALRNLSNPKSVSQTSSKRN